MCSRIRKGSRSREQRESLSERSVVIVGLVETRIQLILQFVILVSFITVPSGRVHLESLVLSRSFSQVCNLPSDRSRVSLTIPHLPFTVLYIFLGSTMQATRTQQFIRYLLIYHNYIIKFFF